MISSSRRVPKLVGNGDDVGDVGQVEREHERGVPPCWPQPRGKSSPTHDKNEGMTLLSYLFVILHLFLMTLLLLLLLLPFGRRCCSVTAPTTAATTTARTAAPPPDDDDVATESIMISKTITTGASLDSEER